MLFHHLRHIALAASILPLSFAQESVPSDLTAAFGSSGTDIQVAYTGKAVDGFKDGAKFTTAQVAKVPTFALGDSSGIVPKARYTVILVDTTEDDKRTLHFAQSNFALTEIVNIASETTPALAYQAPGAFKETGEHQYTFLLYQHFANAEKDTLKIPDEGATFTVKQFEDDNGFTDPVGGLAMVVDLSASGGDAPVSSSAVQQTSSTAIEVATSSVVEEQPESTPAATSSVRASSVVVTRISSAIVSSATDDSEAPETTAEVPETTAQAPETTAQAPETTADAPEATSATPRSTGLVIASSILQSTGPSTSILTLPSSTGTPTGTPTGTGGAAQQTDSGASGLALGTATCAVGAAMVVFAGLLAW